MFREKNKEGKNGRVLPPGWWKTVDANTGKPYYYTSDGKRQWHFPGDEPDSESDDDDDDDEEEKNVSQNIIDPEEERKSFERSIMMSILKFLFFPFQSIPKTAIWILVQAVFIILEVVIGFVCLNGQAETSYYSLLKSVSVEEPLDLVSTKISRSAAFLPIFLIVDGLVWGGELVLHYIFLGMGVSEYLLEHPPVFDASISELFDNEHMFQKVLFFINLAVFCAVRLFQLVWSIIASFKYALTVLVPLENYAVTRLRELSEIRSYYRMCDVLRGVAIAYIVLNFISLTLWGLFCVLLTYLRLAGKGLVKKKTTSS